MTLLTKEKIMITRLFKHSLRVSDLKASEIWAIWQDVSNWPQWNQGLERCTINGPFETGQTFSIMPKGDASSTQPFTATLTKVIENVVFDDKTPVPWGIVNGSHQIREDANGLEIYHEIRAEVNPEKIQFFDSVVSKKWEHGLPAALESVVNLARAKRLAETARSSSFKM